ncbi:DNA polymerase III subunit beta [uncultured Megasphaera sp.]|uniref:DNA polymerase III subunit beta n=1 Tax=uncultured Megasphaera sp. TaxID=165188 RepID=UPI00265803C7|nr:DNA polymerase III subunit beta [uncultured Megasphaera sp.]
MKLLLKKADLNKGLQTVQKVAQNKSNNLSSENGLLIKALNGVIEFQANDYDMGIKTIVPGIIQEPGEAFIANPYLMELTRKLPSDEIEITKKDTDTQLLIKGGNLKFECLTMNTGDFNEVELLENGYASLTTTSVVLKDLIDNTSYACATDLARPIFMGTFLDVEGNTISMVATDTHRLSLKTATLDIPVDTPLKAVIPSRLLSEISRQLPTDVPETVEITAVRNYISVKFGNVYIRTRLIEGEFPNYRRVIPKDFQCTVTVSRSEFTGAVERASIVAKDAQYNVINFVFDGNEIRLTSQHPDYGTIEDFVPCQIEGEPLDIAFNGKFILDILKHCYDDEVVLEARKNSPMLVQDKGHEECVFVVTPMRTK